MSQGQDSTSRGADVGSPGPTRRTMLIRGKLTLIIMGVCLCTLLLAGALLGYHRQRVLRQQLVDELVTLSEILARNSTGALSFNDPVDGKEVLRSLAASPAVAYANLHRANSRLFAEYRRRGFTAAPQQPPPGLHRFDRDWLVVSTPVLLAGKPLGRILVQSDLRKVQASLRRAVQVFAAILALGLLFAFALSRGLQRIITRPLQHLTRTAGQVSNQRDYSVRAEVRTDDEVGRLAAAFNDMLDEVETRDRALREREELLRRTFESTDDGLLVTDGAGAAVDHNARLLQMWSLPPEVIARCEAGDRAALITSLRAAAEDPEALSPQFGVAPTGEAPALTEVRTRHGSIFEYTSSPLRRDDEVVGRVWSFRDVTHRRKDEAHRRTLEQRVEQAQRLESLGVLAGGIAHDFNNLLTGILGNTELARMGCEDDPEQQDLLSDVMGSAEQAAELCQQMLAYSGKGKLVTETFDLSALVDEMAQMLAASISKKVALRKTLTPDLPAVYVDGTQLRQVVMNLLINASEAIGERSGEVLVHTGYRRFTAAEIAQQSCAKEPLAAGDYVFLEVADDGCGMDRATQERIFEPFYSTKFAGRGLGLSAVLGIVRSHGGALLLHSAPDQGTTFQVLLPPAGDQAVASEATATPARPTCPARGTVLVVDDEPMSLQVAGRMLQRLGYEIRTASDGREALEVIESAEIDCMLLDLIMPEMDGEECLSVLRRRGHALPVIIVSGYNEASALQLLRDPRVGFMRKPFRQQVLAQELGKVLSAPPGPGPAAE